MIKKVGFRIKRGERMTQNYINTNKIKENKYKILRMSLILGSDSNRDETLNNFEESAREIDAMNDETYLSELETKFYDTLKLEEEEKKLTELVDYIGGRVDQRISLLSDFANITGYDLSNLPPIKHYDKLDDLKERLKYIREYLSNTEQINNLVVEIEESETKLKEAYENKKTSEECNERNEEIILSKFSNIIKSISALKDINIDNIDNELNNIILNAEESKKSLDIFMNSYTTLKESGINYEEEIEYKSYVDNAKELYYSNKEQEYLLKIYKLLLNKEKEYSGLIQKRQLINDILTERTSLRNELGIMETDILNSLYDTLDKQYKDIQQQLNTIEDIEFLTGLIESKNNEKNDFEQANQKVEILSLLREFCIIDTYAEIEEPITTQKIEESSFPEYPDLTIEMPVSEVSEVSDEITIPKDIQEEISISDDIFTTNLPEIEETSKSEPEKEEPVKDNQVISVDKATNLDLDLIHSKASKVMKRVGEMLGIKTEKTEIVTVTSDELKSQELSKEEKEISKEEKEIPKENILPEEVTPVINNNSSLEENPLFTNNSLPEENPLFANNLLPEENPLFTSGISNNDVPVDPEDNNNFWFPSDTPDALNELPDLEVSSNNTTFFGDNNMPDLNFPDLKLDFGPNDTEGQ